VTAKGKDLKEARANAYAATEWVKFDNKYMRHDIGKAIDEATTKPEFRDSPTEKEKCFARHFRRTTAAEEFAGVARKGSRHQGNRKEVFFHKGLSKKGRLPSSC
jgi:hypothetical protein